MSDAPRVRAAVVGAGLMGRWHVHAIERAGSQVTAVVDKRRELAVRLAGKRHVVISDDIEDVLRRGAADVVHICTPLATHEPLARAVLRAGVHALVEKPLAPTIEATAALYQLAAEQHVMLAPVHQFLFQRGVLRALRDVDRIGAILHIDFTACSAGGDIGAATRADVLAEILPHPLALISSATRLPLAGLPWRVLRPIDGEMRATVRAGDATVSLVVSLGGRPTMNEMRIIGERGTVHLDLFHGFSVLEGGRVSRVRKIVHPFLRSASTIAAASGNLVRRATEREPAYPGLTELVRRFHAATRGAAPPPITPDEAMDVARTRALLLS